MTPPNIRQAQFIDLDVQSATESRATILATRAATYATVGLGIGGKNRKTWSKVSQHIANMLIQRPHAPRSKRDGGSGSFRRRLAIRVPMQHM